jgi:hypothetical protein
MEAKLFDIRKKNYPNKRGDVFRSLQIFECWVCKATTNKVVMGGSPGYGIRAVCPNSSECWHHEIEEKIKLLDKPHPKSYAEELKKEVKEALEKHKEDIKNDIEGNPDPELKRSVTNTKSYKSGTSCNHYW